MRQFLIPVILFTILVATYRLSQMAQNWHYVVSSESGELLYATSFDDDDDWTLYEGLASAQVVDGRMQIRIENDDSGIYSVARPHFSNFDLRLQARAIDGPQDNAFGVIFRQHNPENYYTFYISSDGFYRVSRVVDGQTKVLSNWHASPVIHTGINAINDIRVIGYKEHFRFYINDSPMAMCIPDDPQAESTPLGTGDCLGGQWKTLLTDDTISSGRLGVAVEVIPGTRASPVVEFDYVLVYGSGAISEIE